MKIIVGLILFFLGIGIAGAQSVGAGVVIGALGLWVLSKITVADEQNFMGVLMLLGGLGAAAPFVQAAWRWISRLLA